MSELELTNSKLEIEDKYALKTIPEMYKNDPESIRYTMIEQTKESRGAFGNIPIRSILNNLGTERIAYIK